jgi:glycosyltransferase involved in cell wall biosynthesis
LSSGGHHAQYLECVMRGWIAASRPGELLVIVSQQTAADHPELLALAEAAAGVDVQVARDTGESRLHFTPGRIADELRNRRIAREYAVRVRADHLVFMHLDGVQLALAADFRFAWPLTISGIYFRPSLHYAALGMTLTRKEKIVSAGKRLVLLAVFRNPHLRTVFSLDPLAVPRLAKLARHTECVFLPEPLWVPPAGAPVPEVVRSVDSGRRRLVIFGFLDARKGIRQVLAALDSLPQAAQRRLALVLAGQFAAPERQSLLDALAAFTASADVTVAVTDGAVPEAEIQPLIAACDLALVTYQRHVGSSGVLLRAAAAGIPVIASDYGLVGATTRKHSLGLVLDARSPEAIAHAIENWLDDSSTIGFDPAKASAFARANTAEAFAETLLTQLLGPAGAPLS